MSSEQNHTTGIDVRRMVSPEEALQIARARGLPILTGVAFKNLDSSMKNAVALLLLQDHDAGIEGHEFIKGKKMTVRPVEEIAPAITAQTREQINAAVVDRYPRSQRPFRVSI